MEQEEINTMEALKLEFNKGVVTKRTAVKARDVYNKYTIDQRVTYCMCTSVKRNVFARQFIEWYEGLDR